MHKMVKCPDHKAKFHTKEVRFRSTADVVTAPND